jgi:GT2 family glycosyltransferase
MSINDPLIDIIIPNWNGAPMLMDCLHSLTNQTFSDFRVTVIDNGSEDDSVSLVEVGFPQARTIQYDKNRGFSVAVNSGIRSATAPWLLLLNNDMEVAPDCMENLRSATQKYPDYQFFALKMLSFHQRDFLDGAGDAVLKGGVGYKLGTMERDSGFYSADRDTFGACAGAGLYKSELFEKVGFFDPDFFAYLEDVDFNMRARRNGFQCRYIGAAKVYHIGSATSGSKINDLTVRLSTRNNFRVLVKNYSFFMFIKFLPSILVYQLMWAIFSCKKKMIVPYCKGILEALRTMPQFMKKRSAILKNLDNIPEKEFVQLIGDAEKEAVNSIMARRTAEGKTNFLLLCYSKLFL